MKIQVLCSSFFIKDGLVTGITVNDGSEMFKTF